MTSKLRQSTINGLIWNFIGTIGNQGIRFIITIILARLLMPEEFGLIGMLAIFIAISQTFLDSGFGAALIQKKQPTQSDYSTVFYFNFVIGLFLFGVLFFSAPYIASFYHEPRLVWLTRLMGSIIIINSFNLIQNAILSKSLKFRTISAVNFLAVVISGIAGVSMAYNGYGVWSLAVQAVVSPLVRTIVLWFLNTWRPSFIISMDSFKSLFAFGSKLLAASLLNTAFNNIYLLLIGKLFSATELGYYSQANRLQEIPTQNLNGTIQSVTFPAFAQIQNENARLKSGYQKAIKLLVFINFPLMLGMIVIADPFIRTLLTEKWLPIVPYFRLLCLIGLLFPIQSLNLNIIKVKGRSDLFLKLEVIKKIIIFIAILTTLPFHSVLLLIAGQLVTTVICYGINSYYSGRFIDYGIKEQIRDIAPFLLNAILMATAMLPLYFVFSQRPALLLISQIGAAVSSYFIIALYLNHDTIQEIFSIIKNTCAKVKVQLSTYGY